MSFRLEEKLSINQRQINEFIYWINKNKAKQIYPPRIVQSIYFYLKDI